VLRTPRDNKVPNEDKGQNKKYLQNLQKFSHQKGTLIKSHSSSCKLFGLAANYLASQKQHWRTSHTNLHHSYIQSYMQTSIQHTIAKERKPKLTCSK